jgi:hypothetical protein
MRRVDRSTTRPQGDPMLKKITLVSLFVVSVAVGASGTVFARSATKAPVPSVPHGLCPLGC